jgi:hypothetical protein
MTSYKTHALNEGIVSPPRESDADAKLNFGGGHVLCYLTVNETMPPGSDWSPGFDPRPVRLKFTLKILALVQVPPPPPEYFGFPQ